MKFSIRTYLTFLITFVFLALLIFFIISAILALRIELNEEIDRQLKIEAKSLLEIFDLEFSGLLNKNEANRIALRDEFIEDLNERFHYKHQFAVFSVETDTRRRIYAGGELKNAQLLLPRGILSKNQGTYNQRFDGRLYRIFISKKDWGTVILGTENETLLKIGDEFKGVLFIGLPFMLILVLIGGHFLAKRALAPVVSAANSAEKISLTNLGQRLSEYDKNDEFGTLVSTLNKMIARLENGVQRIQQFTQDAAHELRTPLTILRGELELLYQHDEISDDTRISLQKMLDRTISLNKLTDDLLILAQSDSGRYPLDKKRFALDKVLKETAEDVKALCEGRSLGIELIRCDKVEFFGDEHLIRRLLLNISDNALKFTEKGSIDFALIEQNEMVEIKISDSGIGIPEMEIPYLFDRFYRAEKSRSHDSGGTGLGLAISKWIVNAHKGNIVIQSKPGMGTKVSITFPVAM